MGAFGAEWTEARAEAEAAAAARHALETARRAHCVGVTLWKRPTARAFLARPDGPQPRLHGSLLAAIAAAQGDGGRVCAWSARAADDALEQCRAAGVEGVLIEDGFLRSVGLGQDLQAPASLALDGLAAHYDAARPSDLEGLISAAAAAARLGAEDPLRARAAALKDAVREHRLEKYTAAKSVSIERPKDGRRVVLVVGQVETDAAVRLGAAAGAGAVRTNAGLLRAARAAEPEAYLIWRPHPDVTAGYRPGRVDAEAEALADLVVAEGGAAGLLEIADAVWTISSLAGFEGLMRGCEVVCLGWPFYAGWGLTRDLGAAPEGLPARRAARPDLEALIGAAYLRYPRYVDPATGRACAAETVLERLASREAGLWRPRSPAIRAAATARAWAARWAARLGRSL